MSDTAIEPTSDAGPDVAAATGESADTQDTGATESLIDFGEGIGQLSLEEARKGYLRQSDYTKKTQALAAERQQSQMAMQLVQALEANPENTLRAVAEAYGVSFDPQADEDDLSGLPEGVVNRIKALEDQGRQYQTWQQQQAQAQAKQQLDTQLGQVKDYATQVGLDYNEDDLLQFALQNNLFDLQAAYLRMNADNLLPAAKQRVQQGMEQKRRLVAQRNGGNAAAARPNAPAQPKSFSEALRGALDEAGVQDLSQVDFS